MRFILNEYLASLKEDGELDACLKQLLLSMKFVPLTTIQKGRQYGVDLPALGQDDEGNEMIFLFVVKQGNFSRKNWDSGNQNDIRPSITEIFDVYIPTRIPKPYDSLPVKIVVCCNGELEQPVSENWAQFVNRYTVLGKLSFDFWGLHQLVEKIEKNQLNEEILTPDVALNFRRALAFIDLPDYDLSHLHKFLVDLLPTKELKPLGERQIIRKIRLASLSMSIIHNWCKKSNNIKPAYVASERIILTTFNWIRGNDLIDKKGVAVDFYALLQNWRGINLEYIEKTADFFTITEGLGLGIGDHNEYCLLTYEQIGIVSMMGLFEVWEFYIATQQSDENATERLKYAFENAEGFANILVNLIKKNPPSLNPRYDEHCIEINLGLILLFEIGLFGVAIEWLQQIIDRLILNFRMANFFPLLYTNPEKLGVEKANDQPSSLLANILIEWCIVLKQFRYYKALRQFFKTSMPSLNLQLWIPDEETENYLYAEDASRKSGSAMINIDLSENPFDQQMNMAEDRVVFNEEKNFYYFRSSVHFLPFLSSRHFRTYPFPNSWRNCMTSNFCFNAIE
jgi:hypothetical protein